MFSSVSSSQPSDTNSILVQVQFAILELTCSGLLVSWILPLEPFEVRILIKTSVPKIGTSPEPAYLK